MNKSKSKQWMSIYGYPENKHQKKRQYAYKKLSPCHTHLTFVSNATVGAESTPIFGSLRNRPTHLLSKKINPERYRSLPVDGSGKAVDAEANGGKDIRSLFSQAGHISNDQENDDHSSDGHSGTFYRRIRILLQDEVLRVVKMIQYCNHHSTAFAVNCSLTVHSFPNSVELLLSAIAFAG